jgi:hypothetical protein
MLPILCGQLEEDGGIGDATQILRYVSHGPPAHPSHEDPCASLPLGLLNLVNTTFSLPLLSVDTFKEPKTTK